jgi:hypothetical protein
MKDPFFIPPVPWLSAAFEPLAKFFSLPSLPLHVHEILAACLFYSAIYYPVSPIVSNLLFPVQYSQLPRKRRLNWDAHVVSIVQSTLINGLSLWVLFVDEERSQMDREARVWGYTGASGMIQALAAGYFLWDLIVTSRNLDVFGIGTLAHAISALLVYALGFVSTKLRVLASGIHFADICSHKAAFRKLLCLHIYSLGALYSFLKYPLVSGQIGNDRVSISTVQRPNPHLHIFFLSPDIWDISILASVW